jgi:adenylate cyclase
MAEPGGERRLAAIVAIDVAGYSRLMGADEKGTLAALKGHRAATDPIGQKHGGRIVGTAGDGVLLEFPSVVAAVECAVEIQAVMAERNADIADDQKMIYRIGINLGDVLVDGDDIYGDGVNVAARLEALAEPGSICVSRTVRNQVRDKIDIVFKDMGEVEVKNIARPVRVFRVLQEGETAAPAARPKPRPRIIAAAAALVIALAAGGTWWWQSRPDFAPVDPAEMKYKLPEKPSIAVLPFDNLSGDPEQDYLGDGLTENIIAVLSTSPDLFIIARNSSFTYKGKATKVQQVALDLGVRYVLEGSVQQSGERLRVTAQLVDAIDGRHLWAERYDRELTDLFALQDDITDKILEAMHVKLTVGEQAKAYRDMNADPDTYRLFIQGRAAFVSFTLEGHALAEKHWTEVAKRQPESLLAKNLQGWLHWQKIVLRLSKDPKNSLAVAREYGEKALSTGQANQNTYLLLASIERTAGNWGPAIAYADLALELAPTNGDVVSVAGAVKIAGGQPQEGVRLLKRAMRLEPYYLPWIPSILSRGHLMLGQYEEVKTIEEARLASAPGNAFAPTEPLLRLAAISVFMDEVGRARQYIEQLLENEPDASVSAVKRGQFNLKDRVFVERYLGALRQAGLPEE